MMNALHVATLATLVTLCLDASSSSAGRTAVTTTYHMNFSGDAGASFNGMCTIQTSGGETALTLSGQVPYKQEIVGHSIRCQLKADGHVVIDIEHDGSRTRSATSGGRINISLR